MSKDAMCPICSCVAIITERSVGLLKSYRGITKYVDLYYLSCNICHSEFGDNAIARKNVVTITEFRQQIDNQLEHK